MKIKRLSSINGYPGDEKDDFKIDVEGNINTISSEKEENKEEKDKVYHVGIQLFLFQPAVLRYPKEVNKEK
ncbi:MAG: hypothetical protein IPL84_12250 [Chitinophagaceae bacterium]|nr:hypothetical protein [Chitinophagaceae bacterium]